MLERVYPATLEEIWALWTTKDGIESFWGPEGFEVEVRDLDLRPGGEMRYVMRAIAPDQIDFLKKAGMPLVNEHPVTYSAVEPPRLLAFRELVDFVPGVPPYDVATSVSLEAVAAGVRLLVTFEAMHDEHWTRLAAMGKEMELDRLGQLLASRR
jgi:uncharacterized protein YndB with AHSA1/START domain